MTASIVLPRAVLAATLGEAARVVEKRHTIPILANALILAEGDGKATVAVTDLEVEYRSTFALDDFAARFAATLPAEMLRAIAAKAEGDDLALAADDHAATVKSGKARWKLMPLPVADFPPAADAEYDARFVLPAPTLAAALANTAFAADQGGKGARTYLCGVHMAAVDVALHFVATDGHKLSLVAMPAPDGAAGAPAITIPSKTVAALEKILDGVRGDAAVEVGRDRFAVTIDVGGRSVRIVSRLVESVFPDYRRVIPAGNDKVTTVDRKRLAAAIERVMMVANERGHAVRLDFASDKLAVVVHNRTGEGAEEEVAGDHPFALSIGVNGRYLAAILATLPAEAVEMRMADPGSPILLATPGRDDRTIVLMPMRAPAKEENEA